MDRLAKVLLLVAALTVVAALAGCGGGDGSDQKSESGAGSQGGSSEGSSRSASSSSPESESNSALTKGQFVNRANVICSSTESDMFEQIEAYEKQNPEIGKGEERKVAAVKDSILIPVMQETIDGIRGLGAPAGDEETVNSILTAMQEANDSAEEKELSSFYQFGNEFKQSDKLAAKYGLTTCTFSF